MNMKPEEEVENTETEEDEETDEGDTTEEDLSRYDEFNINPTHPDNPERRAYLFDNHTPTPEPDDMDLASKALLDYESVESESESGNEDVGISRQEHKPDNKSGAESKREVECAICVELFPVFQALTNLTKMCKHEDEWYMCQSCVDKAIMTDVENGFLRRIGCPMCPSILTHNDVIKALSWDAVEW